MSAERMTVERMEKEYPNKWLFIIEPETYEGTTKLKSGIVQVYSDSRDKIYEASRKFKGNAAVRFTGNDTAQRQRSKMTSYKPRNPN